MFPDVKKNIILAIYDVYHVTGAKRSDIWPFWEV